MKNNFKFLYLFTALAVSMAFSSCSKDKNDQRLLFSIEDDVEMGRQTAHQIDSMNAGKILSEADYPEAYAYLNNAKQEILNSGKIAYKDEFLWEIKIINDETLNAFCTPGGHIYFYTGLIKYLESGDHLIGVLGHEMAHADKRHTSQQLQRQYGIGMMLSILTGGNQSVLTEIAGGLALLTYSRAAETEADAASVEYLGAMPTQYACNGAAGFFQKLLDAGEAGGGPVFLSTHPNAADRVSEINAKAAADGCDTTPSNSDYQSMKSTLP